MKKILFAVLFFISFIDNISQTFPVKTIIETGKRDNRFNVVFLGDGYRIEEMEKYIQDVEATVNKIFEESPYKEYKNLFNVYAIEVPSKESGTSHPGTAPDCYGYKDSVFVRDTYFKTTFDVGSIHRLLVPQNSVYGVLSQNFPDYDVVLMVVNHPWYGGSGGSISTFSTNIQSSEIAIHEAGHSFAGLADEYEYGATGPIYFDGINFTIQTEREKIPWKVWIDPSTPVPTDNAFQNVIGLFEGAYYRSEGVYRPKYNCKMRSLYVEFCEVCKEQHIKTIFNYLDLIDDKYPESDSLFLFADQSMDFSIETLPLSTGDLKIEWHLNNELVIENANVVTLNAAAMSAGKHVLSAKVRHFTKMVRNDPDELLSSYKEWQIEVLGTTDIDEGKNIPKIFDLGQNYPNPFNPGTTIKFSLPEGYNGLVTLKVYDVLGRKISDLINETKTGGDYEIQFDAENLPGGIYFYKLNAGNYSETKKMILLK